MVAGPAGSGKSTLGEALAVRTGLPLLDLDTLTNPLLDVLGVHLPSGHWNDTRWRPVVRPARYACLLGAAADQVRAGVGAVLVAPFTAELAGGDDWQRLLAAVAPVEPVVCWLDAPVPVRSARVAARGAARDRASTAEPTPAASPRIAHLRLDAALPTAQLVDRILRDLSP